MKTTLKYNGIQFTMNANNQGTVYNIWGDEMSHYKYIVYITTPNGKTRFTFYDSFKNWQDNKTELNKDDLKNALENFLSDGQCYECARNFADFCAEFDYDIDDYVRARRAWNGCKRHHEAATRIFGEDYTNILEEIHEEE